LAKAALSLLFQTYGGRKFYYEFQEENGKWHDIKFFRASGELAPWKKKIRCSTAQFSRHATSWNNLFAYMPISKPRNVSRFHPSTSRMQVEHF
jgi:hypothetical protein